MKPTHATGDLCLHSSFSQLVVIKVMSHYVQYPGTCCVERAVCTRSQNRLEEYMYLDLSYQLWGYLHLSPTLALFNV